MNNVYNFFNKHMFKIFILLTILILLIIIFKNNNIIEGVKNTLPPCSPSIERIRKANCSDADECLECTFKQLKVGANFNDSEKDNYDSWMSSISNLDVKETGSLFDCIKNSCNTPTPTPTPTPPPPQTPEQQFKDLADKAFTYCNNIKISKQTDCDALNNCMIKQLKDKVLTHDDENKSLIIKNIIKKYTEPCHESLYQIQGYSPCGSDEIMSTIKGVYDTSNLAKSINTMCNLKSENKTVTVDVLAKALGCNKDKQKLQYIINMDANTLKSATNLNCTNTAKNTSAAKYTCKPDNVTTLNDMNICSLPEEDRALNVGSGDYETLLKDVVETSSCVKTIVDIRRTIKLAQAAALSQEIPGVDVVLDTATAVSAVKTLVDITGCAKAIYGLVGHEDVNAEALKCLSENLEDISSGDPTIFCSKCLDDYDDDCKQIENDSNTNVNGSGTNIDLTKDIKGMNR